MTILETIVIVATLGGVLALLSLLARPREIGSPALALLLCALFAAFTAVQMAVEGPVMFWTNHTANLTGVQVWWDLVMVVIIALFLIAPRARAAGMNLPGWSLLVACTASIGLLAMCARLFWLERRAASEA